MKFIVKSSDKRAGAPCKQAVKGTQKVKQTVLTKGGRDRKEVDIEVTVWTIDAKYANDLAELARENGAFILSSGNPEDAPEIVFTGM